MPVPAPVSDYRLLAARRLPRVVEAVCGRLDALVDDGVRSGVAELLALLKREPSVTMSLPGAERIEQIGNDALDEDRSRAALGKP